MKGMFTGLTAVTLAMAITVAAPARAEDAAQTARDLNAAWDSAFNEGDAAAVAALYAEDGRVVTGDGSVKVGRDEIEALFQAFLDSGFHDHEIGLLSAERSGDILYETGTWEGVGGDGETYGGKIVNIYERQEDGSWKTVLHMWN